MLPTAAPRLFALLVSIACAAACAASEERRPFETSQGGDGGAPAAPTSASSSGGTTTAAKGDGAVGAACAVKADCDQALGLDCLKDIPAVPAAGFPGKSFPGGMCTKKCGQPNPDSPNPADQALDTDCGKTGVCVQSSQSTGQGGTIQMQICVRTCVGMSDCRTLEGYTCTAGAFGQKTCQAP